MDPKDVAKRAASIEKAASVVVPDIGTLLIDDVFLAKNDLDGQKRRGRPEIKWVSGTVDGEPMCWPLRALARMTV